ncbi:MAG: hypothetical protein K6E83_07645 [Clostridium sp.]|nr:hypothetical protein [Clostridium sp.]
MLKLHSIEIIYPEEPFYQFMAERLVKELTSYRIPSSVIKKTGIKSLEQVTEPWLIVLCGPETVDCKEVKERIAEYTAEGRYHNILSLLVRGRSGEGFPQELRFETRLDGTIVEHEPLAANISAKTRRESLRLLPTEMLRLLAPMLKVTFDELRNRRLRSRIRIAVALGTVVLLGAAAFFSYAFSRMKMISGQNRDLQLQYVQAQEARDRAQTQRDAAREEFAGTTAIRARQVMNRGDSELALLLCLEFLPEAGLTTDLPAVLDETLERLCAEGYVPVTAVRAYGKDRYQPDPEPAEEENGLFETKISLPVPEEYDNGQETFSLELEAASEEYGYAVYTGDFDYSKTSAADVFRTRVCFPDDPDKDFYMPFHMEASGWLTADLVLPDGTFIGRQYNTYYRYDPFARKFLPFYDAPENAAAVDVLPGDPDNCREAGIYVGEAPGTQSENEEVFSPYALECDIDRFEEVPGLEGLVFGRTRTRTDDYRLENDDVKTYVFSRSPFRYLYTMEDVIGLFRPENSQYILGLTGKKILVFSADPFRYLYTLEDELTTAIWDRNLDTPHFPDERNWLYVHHNYRKAVYDLNAGKRLCAIMDLGQGYDMEISSEGLILSSVRKVPMLWSPEDGSVAREIQGVEEEEPELFGRYDETTGLRSADTIRVGSIVYEYRESATPLPKDLEGQTELAKQLLNGRELTKKERKTYDLELE